MCDSDYFFRVQDRLVDDGGISGIQIHAVTV